MTRFFLASFVFVVGCGDQGATSTAAPEGGSDALQRPGPAASDPSLPPPIATDGGRADSGGVDSAGPDWIERDNLLSKGFYPDTLVGDPHHAGRILMLKTANVFGPVMAEWADGVVTTGEPTMPAPGTSFLPNIEAVGYDGTGRAVVAGLIVTQTTRSILWKNPGALVWKRKDYAYGIPTGASSGPAFIFVSQGPGGHPLMGRPGSYMRDIGASLDNPLGDFFGSGVSAPPPPASSRLAWSLADSTVFGIEQQSVQRCPLTSANEYACDAPVPAESPSVSTTPADASVVYLSSGGSLQPRELRRSSDGGKTFQSRALPASNARLQLAVSTAAASTVVASSGAQWLLSRDGGGSWKAMALPTTAMCVGPAFDGAGTLFTVCGGKLYSTAL